MLHILIAYKTIDSQRLTQKAQVAACKTKQMKLPAAAILYTQN